jgi:HlyD family secretion protein
MNLHFASFKYKYLLLPFIVGLLVWLAWAWWYGPEVMVVKVQRADLIRSLVASGRVINPHRVDIGVQLTAQVDSIPVNEGDQVQAGQVLMTLVSHDTRAALNQALYTQEQAQIRWQQMAWLQTPLAEQAKVQTQLQLTNAQRNVERNELLFKQGFISVAAREDADRALQLARSQQETAQHQLNSVQAGGSERAAAHAAWMSAQAAARNAQARLAFTQVKAPVSGTLIAREVEAGDVVQAGKILMVLSPQGQVQVVLQIDEKNLRYLRLNQKAWVSADAFADQRFDAILAFINPSVDPLRGSVEVKLDVNSPPDYLRQDMTVSVDLEIDRRDKALLMPASAVHDMASAQPWVNVVRDGRVVRQPLQLGLVSGGQVQVLVGLEQGESVVSSSAMIFKELSRVRALTEMEKP